MEGVIDGIQDVHCYVDDLAYASNTWEEHAALLRAVFTRLSENKVYLNASKCKWGLSSMDFLGMHVGTTRCPSATTSAKDCETIQRQRLCLKSAGSSVS
jgi:hypothetical protein